MSKAHLARLLAGICGVLLTGGAVSMADGAIAVLGILLAGFVLGGMAAEAAFRAFATPDEVRRDLEERTRAED